MNAVPDFKRDLHEVIRRAETISSSPDEEIEEALLAGREEPLPREELHKLSGHVVRALKRQAGQARSPQRTLGPSSRQISALGRLKPNRYSLIAALLIGSLGFGYVASNLPSGGRPAAGPYGGKRFAALTYQRSNSVNDGGPTNGPVLPAEARAHAGSVDVAGGLFHPISGLPSDIIWTGTCTIQVKKGQALKRADQAMALAHRLGGYTVSQDRHNGSSAVDLTIRIPAKRFQAAIVALQRLGKVTYENTSSQDVSLQVVDLGARLQNLKAQRVKLQALFNRSTSVSDTIHVQKVLTSVQGRIEQDQARMRYLANQVNLATLSVAFVTKGRTHPKHHHAGWLVRTLRKAFHGAANVVGGTIIALGYAIPFAFVILALFAAFLLARRLWGRVTVRET